MKKILTILTLILMVPFLMAPIPDQSRPWYETEGEKHWFATPSGTGNCLTWKTACTFRTAVSKCTSTVQDVIHLGEGQHDTDNGVDGNGTTIAVNGVAVIGMGSPRAANAILINSDAAAAIVLKVTGDGFVLDKIHFDNTGEADENVIFLNINGSNRGLITSSTFEQDAGAGGGTGILFDGGANNYFGENLALDNIIDSAIKTNSATYINMRDVFVAHGGTGIDLTGGANDSHLYFFDFTIREQTLGINIAALVDDVGFYRPDLTHNTTNITDASVYDGLHIENGTVAHKAIVMYPAPTPGGPTSLGVVCNSGDGIDTWSAVTDIVPVDTITTPFVITHINVLTATATNIFRVEILYGEAVADTSIGVYQFIVGGSTLPITLPIFTPNIVAAHIPSNAKIGVKVLTDTGGVDSATISLSYQAL